jgi:hypothetical protein
LLHFVLWLLSSEKSADLTLEPLKSVFGLSGKLLEL